LAQLICFRIEHTKAHWFEAPFGTLSAKQKVSIAFIYLEQKKN